MTDKIPITMIDQDFGSTTHQPSGRALEYSATYWYSGSTFYPLQASLTEFMFIQSGPKISCSSITYKIKLRFDFA